MELLDYDHSNMETILRYEAMRIANMLQYYNDNSAQIE
jgi:hypothetical protein